MLLENFLLAINDMEMPAEYFVRTLFAVLSSCFLPCVLLSKAFVTGSFSKGFFSCRNPKSESFFLSALLINFDSIHHIPLLLRLRVRIKSHPSSTFRRLNARTLQGIHSDVGGAARGK